MLGKIPEYLLVPLCIWLSFYVFSILFRYIIYIYCIIYSHNIWSNHSYNIHMALACSCVHACFTPPERRPSANRPWEHPASFSLEIRYNYEKGESVYGKLYKWKMYNCLVYDLYNWSIVYRYHFFDTCFCLRKNAQNGDIWYSIIFWIWCLCWSEMCNRLRNIMRCFCHDDLESVLRFVKDEKKNVFMCFIFVDTLNF